MMQQTEEWNQDRCGFVTASRFGDVLTQSRTSAAQKDAWKRDLASGERSQVEAVLGAMFRKGVLETILGGLKVDQLRPVLEMFDPDLWPGMKATKADMTSYLVRWVKIHPKVLLMQPGLSMDDLSATALSYLHELIAEHLTGQPAESYQSAAMAQGIELEPVARDAYSWETGNAVVQTGFYHHPTEDLVGGSPDGLVDEDGIIEIKCRDQSRIHVATLFQHMPKSHIPQIQGNLWITGREWCDFVSFDGTMPSEHQLYIERVNRDETYVDNLAAAVIEFRDLLVRTLTNIR